MIRPLNTVALSIFAALLLVLTGCSKPAQMPGKPWHHTTEGYRNPAGSPERNSWTDRLPWLLSKFTTFAGATKKPVLPPTHILPKAQVLEGLKSTTGKNTITWLGHMTALLRIDGKTILTDPWLTSHASPIRPLGPKRYVPPALTVNELPPIDFVVISHSHFDHLDLPTIETLPNRSHITAMVPLGLGKYFRKRGYGKVIELDWEKSAASKGMILPLCPSFTGPNGLCSRPMTLCGLAGPLRGRVARVCISVAMQNMAQFMPRRPSAMAGLISLCFPSVPSCRVS